jgi:hypothetical protein
VVRKPGGAVVTARTRDPEPDKPGSGLTVARRSRHLIERLQREVAVIALDHQRLARAGSSWPRSQ